MDASDEPIPQRHHLGLWDTVSIIIGIIIGAGIFRTSSDVFNNVDGPAPALAIWVAGGLACVLGAFCFAELASTYPRSGGEYIYLSRAFGSWMGFLFGWAQLAVVRTGGSIAMVAYVFADYAGKLGNWELSTAAKVGVAAGVIAVLTLINIVGVRSGKLTQNILTVFKVLSLTAILIVGFFLAPPLSAGEALIARFGQVEQILPDSLVLKGGASFQISANVAVTLDDSEKAPQATAKYTPADLKPGMRVKVVVAAAAPEQALRIRAETRPEVFLWVVALIAVMWTYAGWHEGAYVAAEVRQPRRNVPRGLLLGTGAVIVLYVLVNGAYIAGLGYEAAAGSRAIAADLVDRLPGHYGKNVFCVLVLVSTLGAINGMIFTSARIFSEFGRDHRLFAVLGRWHPQLGTPLLALLSQGLFCIGFVVAIAWAFEGEDPFLALLRCTAAVFWLFFLLTGIALIVLRFKDRELVRPYSTPGYPLTPLAFCGFCGLMVCGSVVSGVMQSLIGLGIMLAGVPLYFLSRRLERMPVPSMANRVETRREVPI